MEATLLQWRAVEGADGLPSNGPSCHHIIGPQGHLIAHLPYDRFGKADADLIVQRVNAHDRLVAALEAARGALVDESYGPFPGGDPRSFEPDHEVCTAEEIEAHRLACIAWDKGEGEDRGPSCATFGDGSAWTRTGYGVGTYTWEHDVVPAIDAALALARGEVVA